MPEMTKEQGWNIIHRAVTHLRSSDRATVMKGLAKTNIILADRQDPEKLADMLCAVEPGDNAQFLHAFRRSQAILAAAGIRV